MKLIKQSYAILLRFTTANYFIALFLVQKVYHVAICEICLNQCNLYHTVSIKERCTLLNTNTPNASSTSINTNE